MRHPVLADVRGDRPSRRPALKELQCRIANGQRALRDRRAHQRPRLSAVRVVRAARVRLRRRGLAFRRAHSRVTGGGRAHHRQGDPWAHRHAVLPDASAPYGVEPNRPDARGPDVDRRDVHAGGDRLRRDGVRKALPRLFGCDHRLHENKLRHVAEESSGSSACGVVAKVASLWSRLVNTADQVGKLGKAGETIGSWGSGLAGWWDKLS